MANAELISYIKTQLQFGFTKEQVINALHKSVWDQRAINEAFSEIENTSADVLNNHLLGPIDLLKVSVDTLKKRWKKFYAIYALAFVFCLILGVAFILDALLIVAITISRSVPLIIAGFVASVLLVLTAVELMLWQRSALITAISKDISLKQIIKKSYSRTPALFMANLIFGLLVLGGYVLFIIPGILFTIWFSQAPYIAILEDKKSLEALRLSRARTKGNTLRIIGIGLVVGIAGLLLQLPGDLLTRAGYELIGSIYNILYAVIITPFAVVYFYSLYKNLKSVSVTKIDKKEVKLLPYIVVSIAGYLLIAGTVVFLVLSFRNSVINPHNLTDETTQERTDTVYVPPEKNQGNEFSNDFKSSQLTAFWKIKAALKPEQNTYTRKKIMEAILSSAQLQDQCA